MAVINIETTQNVTIDYELAGLGSRILASIIDYLIVLAYAFFVFIMLSVFFEGETLGAFSIILILIPYMLYDLVSEIAFNGQSIGKRSMGIKVVKLDGSKPTLGSYLIRWASRIVEGMVFLYGIVPILSIAISTKGQRLGDMMAGTTVIRVNKKPHAYRNPLDIINDDDSYVVTYPEAINLTDSDIGIIKESIKSYKVFNNRVAIDAVTSKLEELLNIKCNEPPVHFLSTIVKDYNHLITRDL